MKTKKETLVRTDTIKSATILSTRPNRSPLHPLDFNLDDLRLPRPGEEVFEGSALCVNVIPGEHDGVGSMVSERPDDMLTRLVSKSDLPSMTPKFPLDEDSEATDVTLSQLVEIRPIDHPVSKQPRQFDSAHHKQFDMGEFDLDQLKLPNQPKPKKTEVPRIQTAPQIILIRLTILLCIGTTILSLIALFK